MDFLKGKHKEEVHELVDAAYDFIGKISPKNIKGNFELLIVNGDAKIRLISGRQQHKFLATYDSDGKPKV